MLEIKKKYTYVAVFIITLLFSIPAWAIYQSSTFGNRSGIAGGAPTITNVTFYATARSEAATVNYRFQVVINASTYTGTAVTGQDTTYAENSWSLDNSPDTTTTWTTSEVNSMQPIVQGTSVANVIRVTSFYAKVTWSDLSTNYLYPSSDSSTSFWASSSGIDEYLMVDDPYDTIDNDATYMYGSTDFGVARFEFGDLP